MVEEPRLTFQPGGPRVGPKGFCPGFPVVVFPENIPEVDQGNIPDPGFSQRFLNSRVGSLGLDPCPQHGLVRSGFIEIEGLGALKAPEKKAFAEVGEVPFVGFVHR